MSPSLLKSLDIFSPGQKRPGLRAILLVGALSLGLGGSAVADAGPEKERIVRGLRQVEELKHRDRLGLHPRDENQRPEASAKAFRERYGDEVFERRLRRSWKKEALLAEEWGVEITRTDLQQELNRMARETRRPAKLLRMFELLDRDPNLAAEVLVRPHLVDRELRRHWRTRPDAEGKSFDLWLETRSDGSVAGPRPKAAGLALPKILGSGPDAPDSWTQELPLGPQAKRGQSAVWTGSELIVWGGAVAAPPQDGNWTNAGFSYDPVADTWSPIRLDDSTPEPRAYHAAVWTGSRMIVWGGEAWDAEASPPYYTALGDGGVYDPVEDRWVTTPAAGAPSPRVEPVAAWTGTEMIVWGGLVPSAGASVPPPEIPEYSPLSDGARYDPSFGGWTTLGGVPPTARGRAAAAWTGDELLVVGGYTGSAWISPQADPTAFASYDPATDTWNTSLPQPPSGGMGSPPFEAPRALWTGESLWVAQPASGRLATRYSGGAWTEPPPPPTTTDLRYTTLVWTGRRLMVWGGISGLPGAETVRARGLILDTQTSTWTRISPAPGSPTRRYGHTAVWTGAEMLVWGGASVIPDGNGPGRPAGLVSTGSRFTPDWSSPVDQGTWEPMPTPPEVVGSGHSLLWTGAEMIAWGGESARPTDEGVVYDPVLDTWTPTDAAGAPADRADHGAVWTGSEMIVWGGRGADGSPLADGGIFDPVTNAWSAAPAVGPLAARTDHGTVWTGSKMLVWGGVDDVGSLGDGALYDPALDTWTAIAASPLAARSAHTATWTGTEMVIYGGLTGCPGSCTPTDDGAVYDPAADTWSALFSSPDGTGRWSHTAVWTGEEVLLWGGTDAHGDTQPCLADGVAVDPATPAATAIAAFGEARCRHTAVWNGVEMIVWGGADRLVLDADGGTNLPEIESTTVARYVPSDVGWTVGEASVPGVQQHRAVWTGEEMLAWGGLPQISGSLGVYYTDTRPTALPELAIDGAPGNEVLLGGALEVVELSHALPVAFFDDVEGAELWTAQAPWSVSVAGACSSAGDFVSPVSSWRFGESGICHYRGDPGTFALVADETFTFTAETVLELRYLLGTDPVGNPAEQDSARIELSGDGGASWTVIAVDRRTREKGLHPGAAPLDDLGETWRGLALAVGDFVAPTTQGKVRFVFERNGSLNNGIGWMLDDLLVGEPAGDGRLPSDTLVASDGSTARHHAPFHDRWDRPRFAWDLDGDGVADNPDARTPSFQVDESQLAAYGLGQPGTYDLALVVTDAGGQRESASVALTVVDGEPPTVKLLSPNGGEAWAAGSVHVITWSASDNIALDGFELSYLDEEAGTGPLPIACPETLDADARSCTWTLPETTSTAVRVQITARDRRPAPGGPNVATDTSDAPFYLVQANSDEIRTLVVWHRDRIESRFGTPAADALGGGLATLASHVKIDGQVLDLANVPGLALLYDAWDATPWTTGAADDLDDDDLADNVLRAQELAAAIRTYLYEQISQSFTNLEFLILAGGDASIPLWRLEEDLPRYPESNYIAELQTFGFLDDASSPEAFCDETESPTWAATCFDAYLADGPYGASRATDVPGSSSTWWLPDVAVGRLVETPAQILGLIDVFIAQDGVTVVDRALSSGYDFLTDGGDAIHGLLQARLASTPVERLSQAVSLWSDDDLLGPLFGVAPAEPSDLSFINGHADHRAHGAAQSGDGGILTTQEMEAAAVHNRGAVVIGVGCHSALPVTADGGAADETDPAFLLDLPELLARRSFPVLVGNGGYGWGLSEGVGLSEQLMLFVAEEITDSEQIAVGEALRLAKQEYFLRQSRLDAFDHKVLHGAALFGIPNYEVRVESAGESVASVKTRPSLADAAAGSFEKTDGRGLRVSPPVTVVPEGAAPGKGLGSLRILDFEFTAYTAGQDTDGDPGTVDWQEAYARFDWCEDALGESVPCSGAPGEEPIGTFFTLDGLASTESGRPIQPMISFDSRLFGTQLHGVLIRGGEVIQPEAVNPLDPERCTDELGTVHRCFNPVIGNPETEVDEEEGPAPTPFINLDTPTPFINLDTPTSNGFFAGVDPGGRFDTMNAPMGVAVRRGVREVAPGQREEIFSQWLYRTRSFTNYYSNSSDWEPPTIGAFTADCLSELAGNDCFHTSDGETAVFDVPVTDAGDGIFRVFLTYTEGVDAEGLGAWQTVELAPTGPGRFGTSLVLGRTAFYLVQAVDWAGNIGTVDVSGNDLDAEGNPLGSTFEVPRLFVVETTDGPFFADGFENGDTDAWSSTVP